MLRGLAALGRGAFEDAYQSAAAISPAGVLASHIPAALWVPMDLVEAAVRTGRDAEASAHVTAMRDAGIAVLSPGALLATASRRSPRRMTSLPGYSKKRSPSRAPTASRSTWPGCVCATANGCAAPGPPRGRLQRDVPLLRNPARRNLRLDRTQSRARAKTLADASARANAVEQSRPQSGRRRTPRRGQGEGL